MSYKLNLFARQTWKDNRLAYNDSTDNLIALDSDLGWGFGFGFDHFILILKSNSCGLRISILSIPTMENNTQLHDQMNYSEYNQTVWITIITMIHSTVVFQRFAVFSDFFWLFYCDKLKRHCIWVILYECYSRDDITESTLFNRNVLSNEF